MIIKTQYSSENGLCALVKWYQLPYQQEGSPGNPYDRPGLFGGCHYRITLSNETSHETIALTLVSLKNFLFIFFN